MPGRGSTLSWIVAIGVTIVGLASLFWPADDLPSMLESVWDKVPHVGLFLVLTLAWLWTGLGIGRVLLILAALIVGSEVGQELLPIGRSGDVADAIADAVGVIVALIGVGIFSAVRKQPNLTSTAE